MEGPNAVISQTGGPPEPSADYPGALLFPRTYGKPNVRAHRHLWRPLQHRRQHYAGALTCSSTSVTRIAPTSARSTWPPPRPPSERCRPRTVAPRQRHLCLDRPRQRHAHRDQDVARSFRRATSSGARGTLAQIQQTEAVTGIPLSLAEHASAAGSSYEVSPRGLHLGLHPGQPGPLGVPGRDHGHTGVTRPRQPASARLADMIRASYAHLAAPVARVPEQEDNRWTMSIDTAASGEEPSFLQKHLSSALAGCRFRTPIGTQRVLQIVLGAFWIIDAGLQYQPFMFGNQFVSTYVTKNASGQTRGPISWLITTVGRFVLAERRRPGTLSSPQFRS